MLLLVTAWHTVHTGSSRLVESRVDCHLVSLADVYDVAALPTTDGRNAMAIVRRFARRTSLRTKTIVVI